MKERINDKVEEIEKYLGMLKEIVPSNLEGYIQDFKTKAACERYTEIITEAIVNLAFLIIRIKKFPMPENDLEALDILSKQKIISSELADKLKDAKRMRNVLAHEYGTVDDEIVFHSIKEELVEDVSEFIKNIEDGVL